MKLSFKALCGVINSCIRKLFAPEKLKLKGAKNFIGKNVSLSISKGKVIGQGKTWISSNSFIECKDSKVEIGHNTFFNRNLYLVSYKGVKIGSNNLFGPNVVITDQNHRYDDLSTSICKQGYSLKPITIGDDCWICANVCICAGATIGNHVVVAANSVVKGNLESNSVYAGNPAVLVRRLN